MNPAPVSALALLLVAGAVNGCSSKAAPAADVGSEGDDQGDQGGGAVPLAASDAGGDAAADALVAPSQALLRVAQLSPAIGGLDVCVAPHGTGTFVGPILAPLAGQGEEDAGPSGVGFAEVSAYVGVTVGQLDVRLVPAGAGGCSASAVIAPSAGEDGGAPGAPLPDAVDLPPLAANESYTLVVSGTTTPDGAGPGEAILRDDTVLAGGNGSLRAVNAVASAPLLDFGLGSFGESWVPLFVDVAFGAASQTADPAAGVADANGYLPVDPASVQTLSARLSTGATGDECVAAGLDLAPGTIVTVFAVGIAPGDPTHPASLLVCGDNLPSGGRLADCSGVN